MTIIRAVGNQKGGVGKTTTLLGMVGAEAHAERKVLVIDLDEQANATAALGGHVRAVDDDELTVYDALMADVPGGMADVIVESTWDNVWLAPASSTLASFDQANVMMVEHRLKHALDGVDLGEWDVVYIDMPPQLGRLVTNGLVVADEILVVTSPEAWAVDGVVKFLETVERVRSVPMMNPGLRVSGILINAFETNRAEHNARWHELEDIAPGQVLGVKIPRLAAAANMAAYGAPLYQTRGSGHGRLTACYEMLVNHLNQGEKR